MLEQNSNAVPNDLKRRCSYVRTSCSCSIVIDVVPRVRKTLDPGRASHFGYLSPGGRT